MLGEQRGVALYEMSGDLYLLNSVISALAATEPVEGNL